MDEEKETKQTQDTAKENNDDGVQSEATSELDRADQIAERQARENDRREKLLVREEALAARKAVGGMSEAGQQKVKPKEISDEDYASEVMQGNNPNEK